MPYFHLRDYGLYMIGWIPSVEETACLSHEFFEWKDDPMWNDNAPARARGGLD